MIELSNEAFAFWRDVYVAAVHSGQKSPRDVADTAAEDFAARVELARAASRLGVVRSLDGVVASVNANKKIDAIKKLRELIPGLGLKDAKDAVEQYMGFGTWPPVVIANFSNTLTGSVSP